MLEDALAKHDDEIDAIITDDKLELEFPDQKTATQKLEVGNKANTKKGAHQQLRDFVSDHGIQLDTFRAAENVHWLANTDPIGDESHEVVVHVRTDRGYPVGIRLNDSLWYIIAPQFDSRDEAESAKNGDSQ